MFSVVARREKKVGIKHSLLKAQKQLGKHHSSSNCSSPTSPEMQTSPESPQNWAHGVSKNDLLLDTYLNVVILSFWRGLLLYN
jgi:hypothetical protein